MVEKETAINIARQIIPDIMKRGFKISDKTPTGESDINFPSGCWYINYSSVQMNHSACGTGRSLYLFIDKETGQVIK